MSLGEFEVSEALLQIILQTAHGWAIVAFESGYELSALDLPLAHNFRRKTPGELVVSFPFVPT